MYEEPEVHQTMPDDRVGDKGDIDEAEEWAYPAKGRVAGE
jgi:hypothetical protein